ncbi:Uncharacterised protein [Actinobacillus equuli]|nr:Uncharacterised protein [Actinobacillus equuli]
MKISEDFLWQAVGFSKNLAKYFTVQKTVIVYIYTGYILQVFYAHSING